MKGIPVDIMVQKLNMDPNHQLVNQKKRNIGSERAWGVEEEVTKILNNGFIRKVKYLEWPVNVVVVPKK